MNIIFKECYSDYAFSLLPRFKLHWRDQVKQLNNLWEDIGVVIDKQDFFSSFTYRCSELLVKSNGYCLKTAFKNANTTWRSDIMTLVSNYVIVLNDHSVPLSAKPAKWVDGALQIDSAVCKSFKL